MSEINQEPNSNNLAKKQAIRVKYNTGKLYFSFF